MARTAKGETRRGGVAVPEGHLTGRPAAVGMPDEAATTGAAARDDGEGRETRESRDGGEGRPLDVEATTLEGIDELLEELEDDPLADPGRADAAGPVAEPVFDDDFIRARRAMNAARDGNVGAALGLGRDLRLGRPLSHAAAPAGQVRDDGGEPVCVEPADACGAPAEDGLTEEIIGSRTVWRGSFLAAEDLAVRLPDGRVAQRDVIRHPGAVAVVALTDEGKMVLVHQYRTPIEQVTLEIPAGKLDPGEDPADAAARELAEETGYAATRMAYLGPIAMAPGYSDEIIHIYMAMGLRFVGASPDDDEFIQVDLVDLGEMVDRVLDGKVTDAKTVVGVLLCDAISRRMEP